MMCSGDGGGGGVDREFERILEVKGLDGCLGSGGGNERREEEGGWYRMQQ